MKILTIKVPSGYKMLEKNFSINFLTKTRVSKDKGNDDLLYLNGGLTYPIETFFIGKNSSGKTTVLNLINLAFTSSVHVDNVISLFPFVSLL